MDITAATAKLAELALQETNMSFCFDEMYTGGILIEWMTCLSVQIAPKDFKSALAAMRTLERLGIKTA